MAERRWASMGLVMLLGAFLARDVSAWGDVGHQIICEIAFQELTPQVRTTITQLLQRDPEFSTFASSCPWPDHPRQRASEHFVNLPRSATRIAQHACPLGAPCVVTAIEKDFRALARPNASPADKLAALKFLGHWVGDVHQPLHVSFKDDRGGNEIDTQGPCQQLQPRPVQDLHAVWDTCIIEQQLGTDIQHIATDLRAQVTDTQRAQWSTTNAKAWANESFAITTAAEVQYCIKKDQACWYDQEHRELTADEGKKQVSVDAAYMERHLPTITQRLTQAGIRLGALLTRALGGS
jgi:hypothetical protein